MKVVLLGPMIDGTEVGEAYVGFKWAEALSQKVELTVLTLHREGRKPLAEQLPGAEVVTWPEPTWLIGSERLKAMLKPSWPILGHYVRQWLRQAMNGGRRFDIGHQIGPNAPRYASPFRGQGLPYVIGPVGGTLQTPPGFRGETGNARWFTRLRALDQLRFRYDHFLRHSFMDAAAVIGVAPYVQDVFRDVPLKRFEVMLELGIDDVVQNVVPAHTGLRLLHVGRGVRTKGLRDAVRAMAQLEDLEGVTLTSAGDGEDLDNCRREARELGVADRVSFLGRIPRADVEKLYQSSDVFVFPSFREPGGSVLYEAMRYGLPVIAANYGGPGHILDDNSGIRLPVTTPDAMARDIAAAVRRLYMDPALRKSLGDGAREKVRRDGLWPNKADRVISLYRELLTARQPALYAN